MPKRKAKRAKIEMVPHQVEAAPQVEVTIEESRPQLEVIEEHDDREDLVEVTYGPNPRQYVTESIPKKDALQKLVGYYSMQRTKMVPKNTAMIDGKQPVKVNTAVVYLKIRRPDVTTGQELEFTKDLPLWIAADRVLNHRYQVVEMITEAEYKRLAIEEDKKKGLHNYVNRSVTVKIPG